MSAYFFFLPKPAALLKQSPGKANSGKSVRANLRKNALTLYKETAKENKLDPYRYLTHVLGLAPNLDQSNPDWAEQLLPENAPKYCKANYRKK